MGERGRPDDAPAPTGAGGGSGKQESAILSIQGRLTEWHAMDPAMREREWKRLVEWVVWLFDTYEFGREYRLPKCWPDHPGLVQELWVLKCWREALYTTDTKAGVTNGQRAGALAQHARAWHNELRAFVAQIKYYAPKCLTGHTRSELTEVWGDEDVIARWLDADPLGGVAAPNAAAVGDDERGGPEAVLGEPTMRARLAGGTAEPHPAGLLGTIASFGHWWICDLDNGTWQRVDDARLVEQLDLLAEGYDDEDDTGDQENLSYMQNSGRESDAE